MRKLFGKTILLAALTALLLTVTAFAAENGTVNADALRLRSEPSTSAPTIGYLNTGAQVEILEDQGEWLYVTYGSKTGYLFAEYVSYGASATVTASASSESVAGKTGVITGSLVNFRAGPSMDDAILTTLTDGTELTIDGIVGEDWCQAQWDGQAGYVKADYVSVNGIPLIDPRGLITGDCVNVRSTPSTDGSIITKVYSGNLVDLLALEGDWYTVLVDGQTGYIRSDFLQVYTGVPGGGLGSDISTTAQSYIGTRYVYGGASASGFDCSGFTMYVYKNFGYSLPHTATGQWKSGYGTRIYSISELQPGDLVFFCDPSRSNGKACSHAGIYVGGGQHIHASSSRSGGVIISDLTSGYYNTYFVGGIRL